MRDRENLDLTGRGTLSQWRMSVYGLSDGPALVGGEVGARSVSDATTYPRVLYRRPAGANECGRPCGVNEVRARNGRIAREGLRTTLTELRHRKTCCSSRARWDSICQGPALSIVGRDRGKLSYSWRHAYGLAECGRYQGSAVNPDSGCPIYLGENGERLLRADFKKATLSEILGCQNGDESHKARRALYSALWHADGTKTRCFSPRWTSSGATCRNSVSAT